LGVVPEAAFRPVLQWDFHEVRSRGVGEIGRRKQPHSQQYLAGLFVERVADRAATPTYIAAAKIYAVHNMEICHDGLRQGLAPIFAGEARREVVSIAAVESISEAAHL